MYMLTILHGRAKISNHTIHQIFLLARDWSKHIMWPNILQPEPGNIREYSPIFKTAHVAKKIWRIINTIASIWGENMLWYLSLDIICSLKLTLFLELQECMLSKNCSLLGIVNVWGQISEHIFVPNGGYCLHMFKPPYHFPFIIYCRQTVVTVQWGEI